LISYPCAYCGLCIVWFGMHRSLTFLVAPSAWCLCCSTNGILAFKNIFSLLLYNFFASRLDPTIFSMYLHIFKWIGLWQPMQQSFAIKSNHSRLVIYICVLRNSIRPLAMVDCTIWWNTLQFSMLCSNKSCKLQYIHPLIDGLTWW
jgi:hypothetical protein